MMKMIVKHFFSDKNKVSKNRAVESYELLKQHEQLKLFDQLPDYTLILNHNRQIVYFNRSFRLFVGADDSSDIIGKQPGKILDCINANGNCCSSSKFCSQCGAAHAIADSLDNQNKSYECCITTTTGKVYNFRVWAHPHQLNNKKYALVIIRNIESEKSNSMLEQVLFHDVNNVASGVNGLLDIIDGSHQNFQKYFGLLDQMSRELVDTISNQYTLHQAEKGVFTPKILKLNSNEIINEVISFFEHHPLLTDKYLTFDESENMIFHSDRRLIKHIVKVMVKNALEASSCGKEISVSSKQCGDKIMFQVHNHGCIDRNVQLNIFKRSFSTKGTGHGWGTYGIKMLSEGYLNGRVWFSTSKSNGTTFFAEYPLLKN